MLQARRQRARLLREAGANTGWPAGVNMGLSRVSADLEVTHVSARPMVPFGAWGGADIPAVAVV